ncbi:MAG: minor capsid protein [Burkholderiales bacterium]|nr:minor capsid protein [Burkholderiales bacterium]
MTDVLRRYAEALNAWAEATALRMLTDVDRSDRQQWASISAEMSHEIQREIASAPTGELLKQRLAEQVTLIKSIPLDAAQRVHELTIKGLESSTRGDDIVQAIMASGDVAKSRAVLIARTEVARTSSLLTQSRAEYIGSTQYIWRTSGDSDVRPGHKAMNGKVFAWADPPEVEENGRYMRHHPGQIWNCRCFPEPIIPE